jgi:RNA polymerase sigma factor (sigma-70 family)
MALAPLQLLGDERLAQMAAAGDRRAFDVLFQRHRRGLERCARSIVGNEHDAQDVLQTAALKAFVGLRGRSPQAPLRSWLYRIATNEAITALRRRRARPAEELGDLVADVTRGPEELLLLREDLRHLLDDLEHISERQRSALLMRQSLGLEYDEIGRRMQTSALAARQCVFSARRALRRSADGREASCATVRATLAQGDGRALRAGPIRAHLRCCPECRALSPGGRVRSRVAALLPALPGFMRALLSGSADPVAAPAKALAVAAVITVSGGGVARDVHPPGAVPEAKANAKTIAPAKRRAKKVVKVTAPVVRHAPIVVAAAATPPAAPVAVAHAAPVAPRKAQVVEKPPPAPEPEPAEPQRREAEHHFSPPPHADIARAPCPEPEHTATSQPAPTPDAQQSPTLPT